MRAGARVEPTNLHHGDAVLLHPLANQGDLRCVQEAGRASAPVCSNCPMHTAVSWPHPHTLRCPSTQVGSLAQLVTSHPQSWITYSGMRTLVVYAEATPLSEVGYTSGVSRRVGGLADRVGHVYSPRRRRHHLRHVPHLRARAVTVHRHRVRRRLGAFCPSLGPHGESPVLWFLRCPRTILQPSHVH